MEQKGGARSPLKSSNSRYIKQISSSIPFKIVATTFAVAFLYIIIIAKE